jgi:hypothetical protein
VVFAVLAVNGPLPLPLESTTAIADVGPKTVVPPVHAAASVTFLTSVNTTEAPL